MYVTQETGDCKLAIDLGLTIDLEQLQLDLQQVQWGQITVVEIIENYSGLKLHMYSLEEPENQWVCTWNQEKPPKIFFLHVIYHK